MSRWAWFAVAAAAAVVAVWVVSPPWTGSDLPDSGTALASAGADGRYEAGGQAAATQDRPRFDAEGRLLRPEGWETWVLAGTSMGLTYNEPDRLPGPGEPPGSFLNVYIQPWAYREFMEDGAFPEGTMFILAGSHPVSKADPARGGFYQGDLRLLEVHLKQAALDSTGWGFYGYGADDAAADLIPGNASCYSCHAAEADYDHAFVQFYPKMRERLGLPDPMEDGP